MVALTATATRSVKADVIAKLELGGCKEVSVSPNRDNIYYKVRRSNTIESDFASIVSLQKTAKIKATRTIVYCRTKNVCADLYQYFHRTLGDDSYYPPDAPKISMNRLFGMFHAQTTDHIKDHIISSMSQACGTVRVVFATVALGMGVNFVNLNHIVHYGAPSSIDDYFQESGRSGRSGDHATSVIYWKPIDAPSRKDLSNPRHVETLAVRSYLENDKECRRSQLVGYFGMSSTPKSVDLLLCCNVCAQLILVLAQD